MSSPTTDHPLDRFDPQLLAALGGLDLKARYLVEGFLNGLHRSPFHGLSVEFSEYRDYQPGDDLRHLDWRLYARSDRLYIKKYTQETNVRMYLVMDTSASMKYRGNAAWGSKLDVARTIGAALGLLMLRQNDAVGLLSLDPDAEGATFIRPSQKPSQFGLLLKHLERLQPAGGPRLSSLLEQTNRLIHRRSVVLFFSDLLEPSESVLSLFQQMRFYGHECLVFQTLDPDELEFPFSKGSVFKDMESENRRLVDPQTLRQKYLERFETFMQRYRDLFQSLEMPHRIVRTDCDPWTVLAGFLLERKRMP